MRPLHTVKEPGPNVRTSGSRRRGVTDAVIVRGDDSISRKPSRRGPAAYPPVSPTPSPGVLAADHLRDLRRAGQVGGDPQLGPAPREELTGWLSRIAVLPGDEALAATWGRLSAAAIRRGRPQPVNDMWIATCCLTHGIPLATLNRKDYEDFGQQIEDALDPESSTPPYHRPASRNFSTFIRVILCEAGLGSNPRPADYEKYGFVHRARYLHGYDGVVPPTALSALVAQMGRSTNRSTAVSPDPLIRSYVIFL